MRSWWPLVVKRPLPLDPVDPQRALIAIAVIRAESPPKEVDRLPLAVVPPFTDPKVARPGGGHGDRQFHDLRRIERATHLPAADVAQFGNRRAFADRAVFQEPWLAARGVDRDTGADEVTARRRLRGNRRVQRKGRGVDVLHHCAGRGQRIGEVRDV